MARRTCLWLAKQATNKALSPVGSKPLSAQEIALGSLRKVSFQLRPEIRRSDKERVAIAIHRTESSKLELGCKRAINKCDEFLLSERC